MSTTLQQEITREDRDSVFMDGESNQYLFENDTAITISSPHPLFDIPVMETYDAFLDELYDLGGDKTHENSYDSVRVLCFKAKEALNSVLTVTEFEQQSIEHATETVKQGNSVSEFTEFTSLWFEQFINKYNDLLHQETPNAFTTLYESAIELQDTEQIDPVTILETIAEALDADLDVTA